MPEVHRTAICQDCGKEFPRKSLAGPCPLFCKKCTRKHRSEFAHEIIVLKTCGWCGELFVPERANKKYHSSDCRRLMRNFLCGLVWHENLKGAWARHNKPGLPPLLPEEKRALIKKYLPLVRGKDHLGSLTPVSTGMERFADGTPNWKQEAKDVAYIKIRTLQKKPKVQYTPNEGDKIRDPQLAQEE
jgi:hypothetical protein